MATYTLQEVAVMYGASKRTLERRIAELKEKNLFNKTAIGAALNEIDVLHLSQLLGFTFADVKQRQMTTNNDTPRMRFQ